MSEALSTVRRRDKVPGSFLTISALNMTRFLTGMDREFKNKKNLYENIHQSSPILPRNKWIIHSTKLCSRKSVMRPNIWDLVSSRERRVTHHRMQ